MKRLWWVHLSCFRTFPLWVVGWKKAPKGGRQRARARAIALWINNSTPTDVNGVRCIWSPIRGPLTRFLTFRFVDDWRKCLFVHQMLWNFVIRRRKNQLEKTVECGQTRWWRVGELFFFFSEQLAPGFQSIPRLTKIGKWFTSFPPLRNSEAQRKLYIYTHTYYELIVFPPIFFCYYRLTHLSGFGCVIGWWCHWRLSSTSLVSLHNKH